MWSIKVLLALLESTVIVDFVVVVVDFVFVVVVVDIVVVINVVALLIAAELIILSCVVKKMFKLRLLKASVEFVRWVRWFVKSFSCRTQLLLRLRLWLSCGFDNMCEGRWFKRYQINCLV